MDRNVVKGYAVWAREELIKRVRAKGLKYGVDENMDLHILPDKALTTEEIIKREKLIDRMEKYGFNETIEEIAYTWFNRFTALCFMEVNGYLPWKIRIFTDSENRFVPCVSLIEIKENIPGVDMDRLVRYGMDSDMESALKYIIIFLCNRLSEMLPGIFEKIDDYTELLFPDNLTREGSVLERMVTSIPSGYWKNHVQIIGWLYQYYNSELKEEITAGLKRNRKITRENIPAATQLFTPDWIVRYMVENSLGKMWNEGHPDMELRKKWRYYVSADRQPVGVQLQCEKMRKAYTGLAPEDIRCMDPCVGSGHVLCYVFDILIDIYRSWGYKVEDAVRLIIEKNIHALDIDKRAGQLAYFSLMMKALEYDGRFLQHKYIPQPHIYYIEESNRIIERINELDTILKNDPQIKMDLYSVLEDMKDAGDYGAIIDIRPVNFNCIYEKLETALAKGRIPVDLYERISRIVKIAELMCGKYHVVITNPPYMGSSGMNEKLGEFVRKNYPDTRLDLFAVFIEKGCRMLKPYGFNAMVTMQSWMFLSGFEKMRRKIFDRYTISSLLHMDIKVMGIVFGTAATVFLNMKSEKYEGIYNEIKIEDIENDVPVTFPVEKNRNVQVSPENFKNIPGIPLCYWAGRKIGEIFSSVSPMSEYGDSKSGLQTGNNNLFLRKWYEVDYENINFHIRNMEMCRKMKEKWIPHPKGGAYRKWYGNLEYVVNFENNAHDMRNYKGTSFIKNPGFYFREGATWSHTTSSFFSARYMPKGTIFNVEAPAFYPCDGYDLYYILGFMNSRVLDTLFDCMTRTMHYMAGDMAKIPLIYDMDKVDMVKKIVTENIKLAEIDWNMYETSWDFKGSPLIGKKGKLSSIYQRYKKEVNERFERVLKNEEKLNKIFIELYGLDDEISFKVQPRDLTLTGIVDSENDIDLNLKGNRYVLTCEEVVKNLISYGAGCILGRYSPGIKGVISGEKSIEKSGYMSEHGMVPVTEDEYFDDDITALFIEFIAECFGKNDLESNLDFIGQVLPGKGGAVERIRDYFMNDFYRDHCRIYGKRPIYWQFDSGKKNGLKVLMYIHRYNPDTVSYMRVNYIHELQSRYAQELHRLEGLRPFYKGSEKVGLTRKIACMKEKIDELYKFEIKVHPIADRRIDPDMDDGIVKNYKLFKGIVGKIKT